MWDNAEVQASNGSYVTLSRHEIVLSFSFIFEKKTSLDDFFKVFTKLYSPIMVETQNTTTLNREIKYDS